MLLEGFYRINQLTVTEDRLRASISLNDKHDVYKGHFPGQAVVPGVIQIQIIKEILEAATETHLFIERIAQVKFLQIINPNQTAEVQLSIEFKKNEEGVAYLVNASIKSVELLFTKLKATFRIND